MKTPRKYFFDFLRGSFDGDGSIYSYWDPRWKSSFMFYLQFTSASRDHLEWLRHTIRQRLDIFGSIKRGKAAHQLTYAKNSARKILKSMYHRENVSALERKREKVKMILEIDAHNRMATIE